MKVFISHSSRDKKFVRTLKDCLNENGIDTFFDEDQLDLGDNLQSKLEGALDTTSHLVIVLSPASTDSKWVQYELKKALENQKTGVTQKIIPIKYRECAIPPEINELLHHDLTNEVVLPIDETGKVKFISDGFEPFILKLVRAIKNNAKAFTSLEKKEIIKTFKTPANQLKENADSVLRGLYEIIGYSNIDAKDKYKKIISESTKIVAADSRPILLPHSLKDKFDLKIGDVLALEYDNRIKSFGHFAGYRVDDLKMVLDKAARDELRLTNKQIYQVEFYTEKKLIQIYSTSYRVPESPSGTFSLMG